MDSFSVVYVMKLGKKAPGKEEEEEEKKPQKWRDGQKNEMDPILCINDRLAAPGNTSPTPPPIDHGRKGMKETDKNETKTKKSENRER